MEKEDYVDKIVEKLSIPELFKRVNLNFELKDRVISVKGTRMQDEFGLTDIESLELEILLSRNYFKVYRYLLNIKEDKIGYDHKIKTLGGYLYRYIVDKLGFVPDLLRKDKATVFKEALKYIKENVDTIDRNDRIMISLLLNTDLHKLPDIDTLLNIGMWLGFEMRLDLMSEYLEMYDRGVINRGIDSIGYFNYLVEMGYRDVGKVRKMLTSEEFKSTLIIKDGKTEKEIEEYIWSYGRGTDWEDKVDDIYKQMKKYNLTKLGAKVEKETPTQISLLRNGDKVLLTMTDIISISLENKGKTNVIYNNEYYDTTLDEIHNSLERVKTLNYTLLQLFSALIKVITKKDLVKVR